VEARPSESDSGTRQPCPLVKSRNIAELQHVAMTRRVGELGFLLARPRGFERLTFAFGGGLSHTDLIDESNDFRNLASLDVAVNR